MRIERLIRFSQVTKLHSAQWICYGLICSMFDPSLLYILFAALPCVSVITSVSLIIDFSQLFANTADTCNQIIGLEG